MHVPTGRLELSEHCPEIPLMGVVSAPLENAWSVQIFHSCSEAGACGGGAGGVREWG